jgi:transcriptional regulator with XRE-family HTH domain
MKNNSAYIRQIHLQLGNRIRIFRKQKNYTIEDLADLAGLHPTFLGLVERGEANPSVTTLSKIAKALDANIFDLFSFLRQDQKIEIHNTKKEELIHELISELIKYDSAKIKLSIDIIKLCMKF